MQASVDMPVSGASYYEMYIVYNRRLELLSTTFYADYNKERDNRNVSTVSQGWATVTFYYFHNYHKLACINSIVHVVAFIMNYSF